MTGATCFFGGFKSFEVPTRRLLECSLEHEWMMALRQIGGMWRGASLDGYGITSLHGMFVTWKDSVIALELQIKSQIKWPSRSLTLAPDRASFPQTYHRQEELDVDVELLNWEDCAQNLVSRVGMLRCEVWPLLQIDGLQDKVQEIRRHWGLVCIKRLIMWCFFSEYFCLFSHILFLDSPNRKVFCCHLSSRWIRLGVKCLHRNTAASWICLERRLDDSSAGHQILDDVKKRPFRTEALRWLC